MDRAQGFLSLYEQGFVRLGAAVPRVFVAEPLEAAERIVALAARASEAGAALVIFPELGLSGYAIDDLLHQRALLDAVSTGLERVVAESAALLPVIVVGAPFRAEHGLFNTAVVIHRGRMLGVVPKSYMPEYREYYEKRQFRAAQDAIGDSVRVGDEVVPFGPRLLFRCRDLPAFALHVEICEDLWVPIPPSTYGALAGATVLATCRLATSRSARPSTEGGCAPRSPPARSPATCTRPRAGASRPPTWLGTDRH